MFHLLSELSNWNPLWRKLFPIYSKGNFQVLYIAYPYVMEKWLHLGIYGVTLSNALLWTGSLSPSFWYGCVLFTKSDYQRSLYPSMWPLLIMRGKCQDSENFWHELIFFNLNIAHLSVFKSNNLKLNSLLIISHSIQGYLTSA